MGGQLTLWYDEEGDYLEVTVTDRLGYFEDAGDDVYKRVDQNGNLIGFAILNFRRHERKSRNIELPFELLLQE